MLNRINTEQQILNATRTQRNKHIIIFTKLATGEPNIKQEPISLQGPRLSLATLPCLFDTARSFLRFKILEGRPQNNSARKIGKSKLLLIYVCGDKKKQNVIKIPLTHKLPALLNCPKHGQARAATWWQAGKNKGTFT